MSDEASEVGVGMLGEIPRMRVTSLIGCQMSDT